MKPGDLVKLVLPGETGGWAAGRVVVSWHVRGPAADAPLATRFPEGTLAVFLGDETGGLDRDERSILIEGRVGWVWPKYLEVL